MSIVVILSLLTGMVLGQRFKVLILVPATLLAFLLAVGVGFALAEAASILLLASLAAVVSLQVGYLFGIGIRYALLIARASRLRATSFGRPLHVRRPAH
jgi:hypothetical protein